MSAILHVEVVSAARPLQTADCGVATTNRTLYLKSIMSQPGSHGAVHDDPQGVDRMKAEADRDEGGGVVERRLHRVHVRPGEGGRVVGLVVEGVDLPIQSEPNILFLFGT